ncbi:hypothetical protein XENTR_v10013599 [Xenopus tropicalis]|nr:hypothetical protein XENTR_v10013599 [Xenopus tropicalis]
MRDKNLFSSKRPIITLSSYQLKSFLSNKSEIPLEEFSSYCTERQRNAQRGCGMCPPLQRILESQGFMEKLNDRNVLLIIYRNSSKLTNCSSLKVISTKIIAVFSVRVSGGTLTMQDGCPPLGTNNRNPQQLLGLRLVIQ